MVNLAVSGDVFNLNADGGFEGIWHSSGRGGIGARASVAAELLVCHGASAEISLEAIAELQGILTVFLPSLQVNAQGLAAAGVKGTLRLAPDLFNDFGFTANGSAYAELSAVGRLAVGLSFREIADLARNQINGLAYDLFITFLNEVRIEAG